MAFIADPESLRTYDPDRGYELRVTGGGSDGNASFEIDMPGRILHFSARIDCDLTPEELEVFGRKSSEQLGIWLVYSLVPLYEDRAVIREALLVFKMGSGGDFPNTRWFVRFGKKGGVSDA